jgi:hypothetical protein
MINSSLMEELAKILEEWNKKGIFLLRLDHGYSAPCDCDHEVCRATTPEGDLLDMLGSVKPPAVLRVTDCQYLFSARRRNADAGRLISRLQKCGVILETRFPKTFNNLKTFFEKQKIPYLFFDCPSDGSLPPLYSMFRRDSEFYNYHLNYEWRTGLDMARGTSVVIEIAGIISREPVPLTISVLAGKMGITLGAAASYLRWMEDAALVRKTGKGFKLRHVGLYSLFGSTAPAGAPSYIFRKSDPMDLD